MDLPYLAVLWNPSITAATCIAESILNAKSFTTWHIILQAPGIRVLMDRPRTPRPLTTLRLTADRGIILGALFNRKTSLPASQLEIDREFPSCNDTTEVLNKLTRNYWGGYVAVIQDPQCGRHHVLRDCSGIVPCYYTATGTVTLLSSNARNFFSRTDNHRACSLPPKPRINWKYVTAFLANSQLQIRDTGLTDVYELLAGETLSADAGRFELQLAWNPASFVDTHTQSRLQDTLASLRDVTQSSIDAWAGAHDWIIHSLSGGFDSSLVLALLNRSPNRPHVVCVNRYSTGPAEDERIYARIAARAARTPLVECPWNFGNIALDASCLKFSFGAKPSISALISSFETNFMSSLRRSHTFDSIWTGEGGDHLFLAITTALIAVDFILDRGFNGGLLDVIRNTSRLTGRAIPQLAVESIREIMAPRIRRRSPSNAPESPFLLRPIDPGELREYSCNPWSIASEHALPAKHHQIALLAEVIHRNRPLAQLQGAVELSPLLSQPIIEECLAIPSYLLLLDGRKRGLARQAFSDIVPREILDREMKGQTTHHGLGLLERSLTFMRELLLNGELQHHAIISSGTLASHLTGATPISDVTLFPLLACLTAEVWIRSWNDIDNPRF